jgi:hypothetical protein
MQTGGSGGSLATGGVSASGGRATGGATSGGTGGSVMTGGTGGTVSDGGRGGTVMNGGRAAGGAPMTGGANATGGSPSGGAPTGGAGASGGTAGSSAGGSGGGAAGVPNDPNWKPPDMSDAKLIVLYQAQQRTAMTYSVGMMLQLKNQTDAAYDLSKVTIRYWFSSEAAPMPRFDYTATGLSAASAPTFVGNAGNSYLEISFKTGGTAPVYVDQNSLNNTNMSVACQAQSNTGQFNQGNDWSYDSTASAYKENPKMTVYDDGVLIYGCEPSHTCAVIDDTAGTGGTAGTPGVAGSGTM